MPYYPPTVTPSAHAPTHKSGGTDSIKLDEFAAPTDIVTLNASTSAHGLMQKYPNTKYQALRGDGTFSSSFRRDSPQAWEWYTFGSPAFTGLSFIRARGTEAAPLRTRSGDLISALTGYGYNAADDVTGALLDSNSTVAIEFSATGAHTATSQPGKIAISTTPVGAVTPLVRWTIGDDGGLTPTAPAYLNVKLDDLVAPDDNTDLNASTSAHGLMMKYPGGTTTFLRADGTFATPTASAAVTFTEFTKDLGVARRSGTFDLTGLSGLTADKPVTAFQTAAIVASKGNARDESEMDRINISGYVVDATTIRFYWQAPSVVVGTYAFAYLVGA